MSVLRLRNDHKAAVSDTKPTHKSVQQQQHSDARLAIIREQERQQQQQQHQM